MVEGCDRPTGRTVAVVATVVAGNMICRLPRNSAAIMAGRTFARCRRGVHHLHSAPGLIRMTEIAIFQSLDMIRRFAGCGNPATTGMAGRALPWCPFKDAVDVTLIAAEICMVPL